MPAARPLANLADFQPLRIAPLDQLPRALAELCEAALQRRESRADQTLIAIRALVEQFEHRVISPDRSRATLPPMLPHQIRRHAQPPRPQRLGEIDLAQLSPQQKKCFLCQIMRLESIIQPHGNERPHRRLMGGDDLAESVQVAWKFCWHL